MRGYLAVVWLQLPVQFACSLTSGKDRQEYTLVTIITIIVGQRA